MLQDLDFGYLDNQYREKSPQPRDRLLCMRAGEILIARAEDKIGATETALGYEPNTRDIDDEDLNLSMYEMRSLLSIDRDLWIEECRDAREFYEKIGKVPQELYDELDALESRLNRGYHN